MGRLGGVEPSKLNEVVRSVADLVDITVKPVEAEVHPKITVEAVQMTD